MPKTVKCSWVECKHNSSDRPGDMGDCNFKDDIELKYVGADVEGEFTDCMVCNQYECRREYKGC